MNVIKRIQCVFCNSAKRAHIAKLKLVPFSGKAWLDITSIKAENPAAWVFAIKMDSHLGKGMTEVRC